MKAGTIDVTCKTRKGVLKLYDKLQKLDAVAFVKLCEQDNVNVVVGWVPIPMPNERIKSDFQNAFGPVIKVLQRVSRWPSIGRKNSYYAKRCFRKKSYTQLF